jgi:hypothetical protein
MVYSSYLVIALAILALILMGFGVSGHLIGRLE